MIEKTGDITDKTPAQQDQPQQCSSGRCPPKRDKNANDTRTDHAATRAADAVAGAARPK